MYCEEHNKVWQGVEMSAWEENDTPSEATVEAFLHLTSFCSDCMKIHREVYGSQIDRVEGELLAAAEDMIIHSNGRRLSDLGEDEPF